MKESFNIDVIGVGGEKTASSWIFSCLSEHPEICGSNPKETDFFNTVHYPGQPRKETSNYEKEGIEGYKKFFTHCKEHLIKLEYTATYLHDKNVAYRIYKHFPNAKILISLRNPVDRSFSQYNGFLGRGYYKSFEDALDKEPEFTRRSMYTEYVKEYLDLFPRENVLVIFYEDIAKDPIAFIQKIYGFIGVDQNFIPSEALQKRRSTQEKQFLAIKRKIISLPLGKWLLELLEKTKLKVFLKKVMNIFVGKPSMNKSTRERLQKIFEKDIKNLEKLLDKDLSSWKN